MQDAADAFTHFAGGASTERDCKQTVRRRALFEHVEISSGKDTSLPGSGRGDYQCRFVSSLGSSAMIVIECGEEGRFFFDILKCGGCHYSFILFTLSLRYLLKKFWWC